MAVKENIEEAEDFDFGEYSFKPEETEINGKKVLDYTGIEHDRIFLVNKKDITTKKRPDWIPELDAAGLEADQFLPVCVMDGDGNYFVQSKIKTGEEERKLKNTGRTIKTPVYDTEYYKMSRDLLAATVDYYLKKKRAELKEAGSSRKVSLPRALKTMRASRYEEMVGLLDLCESYKDNSEILDPKLSHFSDAYKKQNRVIFVEQWQPLLRAIVDKRLDMNLQKQDCANTFAKGEETAYGKSGSSNALYDKFGVMIKKQNGSTFSAGQRNRLENTLSAVWPHFGDLRSLAGQSGLTISYADDCNQHARKAVGLYRAMPGEKGEKAIGVSFFNDERNDRNPAAVTLSHEVTHWLDSEKGKETHHFFASDAAGTLENRIAMKFKELVRDNEKRLNDLSSRFTKDKKQSSLGDYWFRTCECLARAMEEHYALSQGLMIFEENPAYLPREQFLKEIEPLAVELIGENKKHFRMEVMEKTESVTPAEQMLRDSFLPDEAGIRKLAASHKKVSGELKAVIDGSPDTFNYLRGANKAMDNKVEAYQKKVARLSTKKRVLELDMRLMAKLSLSAIEWDELERNSAPVDKDNLRLLERGSFEYYAAIVTSANRNAGISLPKSVPLVLELPAGFRLDFLEKGEDGYSVGNNGGWTMPVEEYADIRAANEKLFEKLEGLPDEISHEQPAAAAEPVNNGGLRTKPLGLNNQALYNLFAINNESLSYFKNYAENLYDIMDTEHASLNIGSGIIDVGPAVELIFRQNFSDSYSSSKTIYGDTKSICEWVEDYLRENDIRSKYRFRKAVSGFEKEYKDLLNPVFELVKGGVGAKILDFTQKISNGAFGDELKHGFEKYVAESGYAPETFVSRMFKRRELDQSISGVDVINHEFGQEDTPQLSGNGEFPGLLDESQWEEVYLKKFSRLEPGEKFREFRSELEKSLADKDKVEALKNISGKISVNFETVMESISEYVSWKEVQEDIRKFAEKRPYLSYEGWKETIANRLGEPSYTGLRIAVNNDQKPWLKIKRSEYENQFAGIKSDFRERDSETFSDEEFSRRFSAGEFDDIFQRLQKSILAINSRSYESNDKETNEENEHKKAFEYAVAWNRLFVNGEPESVRNLRDKWNEKLRTEKEGFLAKKAEYEKVAGETSDERILELAKEIESFKREVPEVYRAESFSKKQERVFKQAVLDCIGLSDTKYGRGSLETLKNFISPQVLPSFFQEFEQMREEIVMREIERRGISISDIKENKLMETKENTEHKPYSFFVKDGAEFDEDFEPITGLTAKEAVSEYMNKPSSVIGVHIPTNRILNTPDGEGMWVLSRLQDGVHHLDDTFLQKGQETTRNDENFIDALSELEEECSVQGLYLSVPFVFRELQGALRDKRLEEKAAKELRPADPNWEEDKELLEEAKQLDRSSRPKTSMWGSVQSCHKLIPGVYSVSTAGHGGIMVHTSVAEKVLSKEVLDYSEKLIENGYIQFEEDCDAAVPLVDFYRKHLFEGFSWNKGREAEFYEIAQKSILRWNPGLLEKMNEGYDKILEKEAKKNILEEQKKSFVLEKLSAAGIEVVQDKAEFDRILNNAEILQKMQKENNVEDLFVSKNEENLDSEIDKLTIKDVDLKDEFIEISEKTPYILQECGLNDFPVKMYKQKLARALFLEKENFGERRTHGHKGEFSEKDVKDVFSNLANPRYVFNSTKNKDIPDDFYIVGVYDQFDNNKNPMMVSFHFNKDKNEIEANWVTAVYGRNKIDIMKNWIDKGYLLYVNDLEIEKASTDVGTLYMRVMHTVNAHKDTIKRKSDFVNEMEMLFYKQNEQTYGFAHEGKIYLNPEIASSEVAIHEYTHLWDNYTQRTNPELWEKGKNIFKKTSLWEEVKSDPNYADIADNDDLLLSEVHARICGKMAEAVLSRILEKDGELTKDTVIDWDKECWDYIATEIGFQTFDNVNPELKIKTEDLKQFLSMPMKDLMEGREITQKREKNMEKENTEGVLYDESKDKSERLERISSLLTAAIDKYGAEHIDLIRNDEGQLNIIYHSDNDSFLVDRTEERPEHLDMKELVKVLDSLDVGHNFADAVVREPEKDNAALTASEANERCQKLGYYFEYNDDVDSADIFTEQGGDFIATYGAGGFGYTDDLMDEKGASKIPDEIFREVIALADRFYHATHEEINNEKVHVNEKTPVRVYDAHDIFTQSELDSIRLHTGLDVRDPEYVDLAVYAPVNEDKSRDYKPFFIVATGTDDSRHIWELREGPRGEYISKNRFIQYIFRGKHDYGSYDYHNLTNLIAASRAAGLIDDDFDLKNYDGGSNSVYTAVRNFEKEYLPKIKFIDRNGNDISLHEGLGFDMTDDHALWSKEEVELIAGFEEPVQKISGEKEEMTVTVSLKQLYEHYARDGKEFSHVGDNNVLTDFGRIRHTGEDGNDYYDLFNEEGVLACCDGETVTLKESKDGKNYLINEQDEYPTRFILSDEEFGIATMTRPAQVLGASQEPPRIRLEKWEVGGKTYQVRECFFEKDGKTVTRYVGEEDMANGGYPDKDLEAVDERIAYYVDKEKLKTLSDEELLEYIHDNIDESVYEIFDVEVLKNQVSENRNFVIDGASNGMLAKYINRSEISDIEEFRKFAAERITGTAQDKTYFGQMWKAGVEFCREKGWEVPDVPDEYKGLLLNENKAEEPAILKMPEITLSEKKSRVLPFSIVENVEKKRVNIKFDTMENNPDFPEIIKELKAGGWKFAPSTKQWYPVGKAVEGAKEFAESLQDRYSGILNEPEKAAEAQEKEAADSSSVYDGILFFDRNYDEPKEFARYTGLEEEKATYFLKALGHDYADMNSEKTERFGLDKDKNLVSVMKKDDGSVTLRKFSSVDELLDYACENAQKEYDGIKALYERHQKAQENNDWGKMLDQLYDKALNRWAENLYQVNEIRNAREQEKFAKMSLSQFDKELIDVINGKLPKDHIFSLGIPGVILQRCGFPEGQRIEMSASRLEFKSKLNWHPFDMKDVIGLDSALQTPVAVFAYGNKEKSQNVIVGIDKDGKNFLAGVHFNQKVRGYEVSDLRTLFPKDNIDWIRWITQGKMIYGDKEKLQALIAQQRINVAEVSAQVAQSPLYEHCLESASSIMQKFGDVNDIFTEEHEFYNDIKEKGIIEQKFYTYYSSLGNMDARELSEHEAGEFYDALKSNDAEKIAEYTETDLHEISGVAKVILDEYQAKAVEKTRDVKESGIALNDFNEFLDKKSPYVEVIFSERSGDEYLPDGKIWSLAEADKIIPELNDKFSSYLKTEIAVHFPDGDKPYTRESDCTGTFRLDIGTDRKMESFSDHIRCTCSDIDFIDAFEKAWQKSYVPSLDESFTEDLSQRLSETAKEAGKKLASITERYKKIAGEDNKVHSAFIIEESESKASKAKVGSARGEFRDFFDDTLRDLSETVKKYSASSGFEMTDEALLFAKHAVKNAMIDLYYGESRAAHYGSGFDFTSWRGMIDSIPPVAAYDGLLDIYLGKEKLAGIERLSEQKKAFEDKLEKAEEKLRENPGNPLAAADKTDAENGINAVNADLKKSSPEIPPLEVHDRIGEDTVLDSFKIADGIYQATLGQKTGNGGLAAQSYFVIDGRIALQLSKDARELMDKRDKRYVIGNKYNEPYVLKELIEQKLMPPRDGNFVESLSAYIKRHPLELAKKGFYPVTLDNIQRKTAELAALNKNLAKDPLALAKSIISMVDDDNKGAWLKGHGCNTQDGLRKTFTEWMSGQDKKRQKDSGYPPRGEK